MVSNLYLLFSSFLLLLLLPLLSHAIRFDSSNGGKAQPFDFLKHLEGCHKGEKVKGLNELKHYLEKFGYLNLEEEDDDNFDDILESAIKTYQLNYHLKPTGTLDSQTVNMMMKPRCGMPDILNGTTSMRSGKKKHHHHGSLHTVSHYAFFDGSPKWPSDKTHLTYAILPGSQTINLSPICGSAFAKWSSVTHFTFQEIQDSTNADITVSFHRGDHGDGSPFDGPLGILAHAFPPTNGRFHYDGDETWSNGPTPDAFDLETVALHEIGHLLGLHHSSVEDAIMFSSITAGARKEIHGDDVQGIRALYNV